jgi:hypothetical protein
VRRAAVFAIALLAAGCTSAAESPYQMDLDCFTFYYGVNPNSGSTEDVTARATFRERAIAGGRAHGLSPEQVEARARAGHAAFQTQLNGMGAHSGEELLEQKNTACLARLRG